MTRIGPYALVAAGALALIAAAQPSVLSQTQPDDESADALRAAAPEARSEILEPVPLD